MISQTARRNKTLEQKEYNRVLAGKLERKRSKYTNSHIFKVLSIPR